MDILTKLNNQLDKLAILFRDKYFSYDDGSKAEINCIGVWDDSMRFNYDFEDFYFSVTDMYTALYYDVPYETLMNWYDYSYECHDKWVSPTCLKVYQRYWAMWKPYTKEDKEKDEANIKYAYEQLEKAIEEVKWKWSESENNRTIISIIEEIYND